MKRDKTERKVQVERQIFCMKRKISVCIGGAVCLSILCILAVVFYYEIKMRSVAGALYFSDAEAGKMVIDEMFKNNISSFNVDMFFKGMIFCGYTENGSWYLFKGSGQQAVILFVVLVLIVIIGAMCLIVREIGKKDIFAQLLSMQNESQKLKEQMEQLTIYTKRTNNVMYEFIENVAHQIKTPLTALTLSLDILKEKNKENAHMFDDVLFNAERIKTFIVRLMNISRLESGKVKMSHEEINLSGFLQEAVQLSYTDDCSVDIDFDDVGYCIDGDYDWLLDAFSNVISNSAEHADKVYIGVETSREKCVITIKDNGGGFEKENIDKIFDRFESGNGAKTFHMGIGLNLAKLVIEAHYGKISAYNDYEAGGAVFKIVLPQYQLKKGKI